MTLLAVGSLAFDDLETPSGSRNNVLGGSATYFSLSASRFIPVQVVAVVGEDFGREQFKVFEGRAIDLEGVKRLPGLSFHWKGQYGADLNEARTLETHLNVFAGFRPELPGTFRTAAHLFLGNIDPVLQAEVVRGMAARPKWIALDTMNFWIDGSRAALESVLREIDILLVNEAEARSLTGERNLLKAYKKVLGFGPLRSWWSSVVNMESSFAPPRGSSPFPPSPWAGRPGSHRRRGHLRRGLPGKPGGLRECGHGKPEGLSSPERSWPVPGCRPSGRTGSSRSRTRHSRRPHRGLPRIDPGGMIDPDIAWRRCC